MPAVARTLDPPFGQRFEYWKHVLSDTHIAAATVAAVLLTGQGACAGVQDGGPTAA
jgi:hypothetical protein